MDAKRLAPLLSDHNYTSAEVKRLMLEKETTEKDLMRLQIVLQLRMLKQMGDAKSKM